MRRTTDVLLLLAVVVAFGGACGSDADQRDGHTAGAGTPSLRPTVSAGHDGATKSAGVDVPSPADPTALQTADAAGGGGLVLTDVRASTHPGFDRIVLEFSGQGTPGWAVDYVDDAVLDGSGERVTLRGDAILNVFASGTTWPAPDYYDGPERIAAGGGTVEDVYVGGTFEGYTQVLVGIEGARVPFRAFALTDPSRLVVDLTAGSD